MHPPALLVLVYRRVVLRPFSRCRFPIGGPAAPLLLEIGGGIDELNLKTATVTVYGDAHGAGGSL